MNKAAPGFIFAAIAALSASACNMQGTPTSAKAAASDECKAGSKLGTSDAGLELLTLCIESVGKARSFTVEHAASTREQAQGLMFRKSLPDDTGMIFPYQSPRILGFWMKNTLIPLDIIFIRSDGTIESIAENTTPYSEESVSSGEPVQAVLELRGGLTAELGIKAGDIVSW